MDERLKRWTQEKDDLDRRIEKFKLELLKTTVLFREGIRTLQKHDSETLEDPCIAKALKELLPISPLRLSQGNPRRITVQRKV